MEIQVAKLRDALKLLKPAVPRKTKIDVLKFIFLGEGRAVATDTETTVIVDLSEAKEPMLLPVDLAIDYLERVPGYLKAGVTVKGDTVTLVAGEEEVSWVTKPAEDFPTLPHPAFGHEAVLNGEALVTGLTTVVNCSRVEDERPVLHGVYLEAGEQVRAVGADGFQLGIQAIPGKLPGDTGLIIPREAVGLLEKMWKKAKAPDLSNVETIADLAMAQRPIRLEYNKECLQLRFGTLTMVIKLIEGTYPKYTQLIPADFTSAITLFAEDLRRAVQKVAGIAVSSSGIVRMEWEGETLKVSAKAELAGQSLVRLKVKSTGPGKIALNQAYLNNWLSPLAGEVTISITSPSGPVLFSHRESTRVVMPMFVEWGGDGTKPVAPTTQVADTVPSEPSNNVSDKPSDIEPNDEPFDGAAEVPADVQEAVSTDMQNDESNQTAEEPKPKTRRGRKAKVKA